MDTSCSSSADGEIEERLLAYLQIHRRVLFSALADYFPNCRWQRLFSALHRLRQRRQVELLAQRWDHEVLLHHDHTLK